MMQWIPKLYKYRHISFDLWLTLIKSHPEFKVNRNLLFKEYFQISKPIDEVTAVIRKFDILTNSINEKVGRNFDTFEIYYLILDALAVDIETVSRQQLEDFYTQAHNLLMQYKPVLLQNDIPQALQQLKAEGKTMNILSNTAFIKGSSLKLVLAHYGLDEVFDFQVYSDEVGYSKPSNGIYQCTYNKITAIGNIAKNEVVHVGDNIVSDYNGALAFGFDAHLIINSPVNEPNLQPA